MLLHAISRVAYRSPIILGIGPLSLTHFLKSRIQN